MAIRIIPTIPPVLKPYIIREVAFRAGLTVQNAAKAVDAFTDTIREALAADHDVQLTGFGMFTTHHRQARAGRNPHTGGPVPVPAHRGVVFRASKTLLD